MWPKQQKYPTDSEMRAALERNPGGGSRARQMGRPGIQRRRQRAQSASLKDTQFADYHGHGWNFRAVFKRDRKGNLLDDNNNIIPPTTRRNSRRQCISNRSMSISACSASTAISPRTLTAAATSTARCRPRSRSPAPTATARRRHCPICGPTARRRRPAATDLTLLRTADGRARFEWRGTQALPALGALSRPRMGGDARQGYGRSGEPQIQSAGGAREADVAVAPR